MPRRLSSTTLIRGAACTLLTCLFAALPAARGQFTGETRNPVYVEDSPAVQRMLERAATFQKEERFTDAAAIYQSILNDHADKVAKVEGELYTAASSFALDRLRRDGKLLEAYRRSHEPAASHLLRRAGESENPVLALSTIVERYALCDAGLEAALELAGRQMAMARFGTAASLLDEFSNHPALDEHRQRWHTLQATVGLLADDQSRLQTHINALAKLGHDEAVARLQKWAGTIQPPTQHRDYQALKTLPPTTLPKDIEQPLWSTHLRHVPEVVLASAESVDLRSGAGGQPVLYYHMVPSVVGEHLYINEGGAVTALDRHAGRRLWTRAMQSPQLFDEDERVFTRPDLALPDQRGVAIAGDQLAAVVGQMPLWPIHWRRFGNQTALICIDRHTGKLLWQVEPKVFGKALDNAFFHGTPIIHEQSIFALMRRITASGFQDAYMVALDRSSGKVRWKRHLSSAAATNRYAARMFTQMLLDKGRLYVCDNIGSVACIHASTGRVAWLRTLPDLLTDFNAARVVRSRSAFPWQISPPVLTKAGLLIAPPDASQPLPVIEPDSGRIRHQLKGEGWQNTAMVVPAGPDILTIGERIYLFDGDSLKLKWKRSLGEAGEQPHGRPLVTRKQVIVPLYDRLLAINLADGSIASTQSLKQPGNLLAVDGQLVIAGVDRVRSYLPWSQAYESLTKQIKTSPDDPDPGLSLAHAAIPAGRDKALIEGVTATVKAMLRLTPPSEAQGDPKVIERHVRLFEQLVDLTQPGRVTDEKVRQQIFDLIAGAAIVPREHVIYQLSLGAFLEERRRYIQAVDHYQSILFDATLSRVTVTSDGATRSAEMEARLRLERVIGQAGDAVYAKYEEQARAHLAKLLQEDGADEAELIEMARRFPMTSAGVEALVAAAEVFASRGQATDALSQLRRAYDRAKGTDITARIVGRIVELYESNKQARRARQWLRRAALEHPTLKPLRDGKPVEIDTWLARIAPNASGIGRRPQLGEKFGMARMLEGKLLLPQADPPAMWPRDRFVLHHPDGHIELRDARIGKPRWRHDIGRVAVRLLSHTDEQVLLWQDHPAKLIALEARTGKLLWQPFAIDEAFEDSDVERRAGTRLRRFPRDPFEPLQDETRWLLSLNDMVVCVADREGRVVGIDRHTRRTLWQREVSLTHAQSLIVGEDAVALAGIELGRPGDQRTAIHIIDTITGKARIAPIRDSALLRWVAFAGHDRLLMGAVDAVTAHNLANGQIIWTASARSHQPALFAAADDHLLIYLDLNGCIVVVDARNGQQLGTADGLAANAREALAIEHMHDGWLARSNHGAARIGRQGKITWRDGLSGYPKNLIAHRAAKDHVLLVAANSDDPPHAGQDDSRRPVLIFPLDTNPGATRLQFDAQRPPRYELHLLDRNDGRIIQRQALVRLPGLLEPNRISLLDDAVLLGTGQRTVIISCPRDTGADEDD